jgi:hypothetical protein
LLSGDAAADHAAVRPFVSPASPAGSALLTKAAGQLHGGGAPWPAAGDAHARVLAWISRGARLDGAPGPASSATAPAAPAAPVTPTARRSPIAAMPTPTPPAISDAPENEGVGLPDPSGSPRPEARGPRPSPEAAPPAESLPAVHPLLTTACAACHNARGPAAATRFLLSGDVAADDASARAMLDVAAPARSPLVTKAAGELHAGGIVFPPGDPRLAALLAWAEAAVKPSVPAASAPATARPVAVLAPPPTSAPAPSLAPPGAHGRPSGLVLPGGFLLNGRFDLAYERRQFNGNPFAEGSTAALRSYHHFLFLSRESATDPFGLSLEMLSLQFWEAHARLGGGARPWRLVFAGGKIVVPFGADPLTHQSYGGLAGFDQMILPAIWAQEGAAAHFTFGRGRLLITDDLFAVRGYALRSATGVLNLQGDVSPADDVRVGWGNRLGVSWLGASAWYSLYVNPLGFGRRLFMQALDVTLWRPRAIPVLGRFSVGAGALRADVSGGGSGLDYYHFGSYFQVRGYLTDWLYLQYRQGLRTFDNRRGVIVDTTRLTPEDGSTHNFALVGRYRGLTAALAYYLMFEKAGELPNDFLRLSVTYDF